MNRLNNLRNKIDIIDDKILKLLSERTGISQKVGELKRERGVTVFDEQRWQVVLQSNLRKAEQLNLSKEFVKKIYTIVHQYSLRVQKNS